MSPTTTALVTMGCLFGGIVVGLVLYKLLPDMHLDAFLKDAVKVGAGMVSMMAALVLCLLASSAKNSFDATSTALTESGAKVILLARLLAGHGPKTRDLRAQLRQGVAKTIELLWSDERSGGESLNAFERAKGTEELLARIRALKPETERQSALQAQAQQLGRELLLTRWLQIEQAQVALPMPFLVILLFWLSMLFLSFGLFASSNATVVTALFVGALPLATAVFLIVEMNHPMTGAIKVSSGRCGKPWNSLASPATTYEDLPFCC